MAKLENCPTCQNPTSENADRCPSCGEPLGPGWADELREQRRLELEAKERADRQAALSLKKAKRRRRVVWVAAILLVLYFVFSSDFSDEPPSTRVTDSVPREHPATKAEMDKQESDPDKVSKKKSDKANEEQERLKKISDLEAQVAKVPASSTAENIRLYRELHELDPDNERYTAKIKHYEGRARAQERTAKEAEKQEERRKGFHCLSAWDGSHRGVKRYVREHMRDPDSFEHIDTRITPVDEKGSHVLMMTYRARNGFGGMSVGAATAIIKNSDCSATVTSIE